MALGTLTLEGKVKAKKEEIKQLEEHYKQALNAVENIKQNGFKLLGQLELLQSDLDAYNATVPEVEQHD